MPPSAVTIPQAVELSGLSRSTFYRLFHQGHLKPRKVGTRTLIMVAELENYLTTMTAGSAGHAIAASGPEEV